MMLKLAKWSILLSFLTCMSAAQAAVVGGPTPSTDPLRQPVEPTGAINGMRLKFEVKGLEFLDGASANKKNPEPPRFCGPPVTTVTAYNVWVQDSDKDMGRETESVTFWTEGGGTQGTPASLVDGVTEQPTKCPNARLWSAPITSPPSAVAACDAIGNCGMLPPKGSWPLTSSVRLLEDEASPDGETFADYDILEVDAAGDKDWIYLTMRVRGQVSQGTSSPMQAHLYGFVIMDPSLGDKIQSGHPVGFMAHYMYHYKMANQKSAVLIRYRNDKTKLPDGDISAEAMGQVVHFRIRKKALGLKAGNPLKVIGFAAEVPRLGPLTEVDVKDVTAIGLIQN